MRKTKEFLELQNITTLKNVTFTINKLEDGETWNLLMFHNGNLIWDCRYLTYRYACVDGVAVLTTSSIIWKLDNLGASIPKAGE